MSDTTQLIEREAQKLCGTRPEDTQRLSGLIRASIRNWEEFAREHPAQAKWRLLESYLGRVDVSEEWGSIIYAERISWARDVARRLLIEFGRAKCVRIPEAMRVIRRLMGGQEAEAIAGEVACAGEQA
jgi:hypothetical protein